eukprot:SAG31_NODE_48_length_30945_cov_16.254263_37_plen_184_part_00
MGASRHAAAKQRLDVCVALRQWLCTIPTPAEEDETQMANRQAAEVSELDLEQSLVLEEEIDRLQNMKDKRVAEIDTDLEETLATDRMKDPMQAAGAKAHARELRQRAESTLMGSVLKFKTEHAETTEQLKAEQAETHDQERATRADDIVRKPLDTVAFKEQLVAEEESAKEAMHAFGVSHLLR